MGRNKRRVQLSELQLEVMRVLWTRGEAATAEVVADLRSKRRLAHTTVATLLTRLEKRGVLGHRREGRTLIYRPVVSESEVRRSMVAGLIATLFRGDREALVAHLLREDEVSPGDVAKIRARIKEADRD